MVAMNEYMSHVLELGFSIHPKLTAWISMGKGLIYYLAAIFKIGMT